MSPDDHTRGSDLDAAMARFGGARARLSSAADPLACPETAPGGHR